MVITLFTISCTPRWVKYNWYGLNFDNDFCLFENSQNAYKNSSGIIVPNKILDTLTWTEQFCYHKINKNEFVTVLYTDNDSLVLRDTQKKDGHRGLNFLQSNSINDTISFGTIHFKKFGSIQKSYNSSKELASIDTNLFDFRSRQKYSITTFFGSDTTKLVTKTYFDEFFRNRMTEILDSNGKIEQIYKDEYQHKNTKCLIDTIFRTYSSGGYDSYTIIITKMNYK